MISPPDCAAREDDPRDDEYCGYEPDWEDLAYDLARERELEETVSYIRESERQLRDYDKYTDKQLHSISKEIKSVTLYLAEEYQFDVASDSWEVLLEDGETSVTVYRDGVSRERVLTRKDKQRMRKDWRKRARRLEILTKRGCSPRQVTGYEGGSFYPPVVAATSHA
jgi:hypothetical protein